MVVDTGYHSDYVAPKWAQGKNCIEAPTLLAEYSRGRSFAIEICEIYREQPVANPAGNVFHMSGRRSLHRLNSWVLSLLGSLFLEHGQDIAGGVFEPRDQRPAAAKDSLLVRFEFTLIALEAHASLG